MGELSEPDFRRRLQAVESRLQGLEELPAGQDRDRAVDAVRAVLQLHGDVLGRLIQLISNEGQAGRHLLDLIAKSDAISGLLVLHGLHPASLEERLEAALDSVRPYLGSHGGDVQLVAVADGVVRIRLRGSCSGCPSSAVTLQYAVEDALRRAAPELERIEVEEESKLADEPSGFIPLQEVKTLARRTSGPAAPGWTALTGLAALDSGRPQVLEVGASRLLILRLGDTCWAYGLTCPACAGSLEGAQLDDERLVCPDCHQSYGVRSAGRAENPHGRALHPIPVLVTDGVVNVASHALVA